MIKAKEIAPASSFFKFDLTMHLKIQTDFEQQFLSLVTVHILVEWGE